ncbi:MAG TPA: DNA methyltransferase [Syntrophorhabdus aromaticivorans]|nr:DNA methyltransferase [Syntrophorhabdus aromaticivorans]
MHAKAQQVTEFIEQDLLKIVEDAFGEVDKIQKAALQAKIDDAVETARKFGAPNPEQTDAAREARARYKAVEGSTAAEADIYDHLYRFFERYYNDGDFVSRRYYTRETEARSAPFAVPYNGEEVKLHWANADQYYIKTTEYFSNFTFDLSSAARVQIQKNTKEKVPEMGDLFGDADGNVPDGFRVHFRIVEATEGEHGNVKASDVTKRYFIIHKEKPVEVNDAGEMVINFEYRPDPEKSGQEGTWRDKRNAEAVATILTSVKTMADSKVNLATYLRLFVIPAPTESDKKRPLLAKYVNQYTARNTMDYFIHKDLGGFLRRELDFYIKNEMMRLDDIENAEAPAVESYLAKIKVLRKIAGKLIDFLAQLENFQKKLWLKKKFIVETNYCMTLDRIPEELYPEIAANEAQMEEWVKLFAIDEMKGDLATPGYSVPLTVGFLKANNRLVLDTKCFDENFKARLIASIQDFDEQCDELLVHSENFLALNVLQERYRAQIKCVYIDPPYNTSENAFLYKNSYKHSSWLSMLSGGIALVPKLMSRSGVLMSAIDDTEYSNLKTLLSNTFGDNNYVGTIAVEVNPAGQNIRPNVPARSHDYFHIFGNDIESINMILRGLTSEERNQYKERDSKGRFYWDNLRRRGGNSRPTDRPKQWFPLYVIENNVRVPEMEWNDSSKRWIIKEKPHLDEIEVWPIDPKGEQRIWRVNPDGAWREIEDGEVALIEKAGRKEISLKTREPEGKKPKTLWSESKYSATTYGTKLLLDILGAGLHFSYPKAIHLTTDAIRYWADETAVVMDFFAGSGTTGHAVINLNREDGCRRKYILVEMGDYFDTVLKPRIAKVIYSADWKDGKPTSRQTGISHCFKYLRLESYEDTLNNLRFDDNPTRHKAMASTPSLKEDFMLHYLLDVETKGSQSLLNIDAFSDPTAYTLKVKKPGSDEYVNRNVDLLETFNYLIGLRVVHIAEPQVFNAIFARITDPELPEDQHTKLVIDGKMRKVNDQLLMTSEQIQPEEDPDHCSLSIDHCSWWFRKVEGWVPKNRENSNNGQKEKVLIVWRKLTGDPEKDNLMLDEWFEKNRISTRDFEFDTIYVNGSNNLPNLQKEGDTWKVRLIEEEFMKRMWDIEEV